MKKIRSSLIGRLPQAEIMEQLVIEDETDPFKPEGDHIFLCRPEREYLRAKKRVSDLLEENFTEYTF